MREFKKNILFISGSRSPNGQTAKALRAINEGVIKTKVLCETIFLSDFKIEHCKQCKMNGFGMCLDKGQCVIQDDFLSIIDKIKNADLVVFGTPVYWRDLSESLKVFLDRLRRICLHKDGCIGIENKPAVGVCVAGGGGGGAPKCCFSLEYILDNKFDVIDMIAVRRQNLDVKLKQLKIVGQWLSEIPTSEKII